MNSPPTHINYVAARAEDTLVGYAGISRLGRTPPYEYEIHTIGVDPAYQGRGIGRGLLTRLLEFADGGAVFLEVRTDNAAAIALYESAGFVNVGRAQALLPGQRCRRLHDEAPAPRRR